MRYLLAKVKYVTGEWVHFKITNTLRWRHRSVHLRNDAKSHGWLNLMLSFIGIHVKHYRINVWQQIFIQSLQ
jgi:hypothetical protein